AVAIGAFYAVTDEFHQLFVEGRGGTTEDVLIDSAGVLFGVLVVLLAVWLVARGKERKAVKAVKTVKTGNDAVRNGAEHNGSEHNAAVHSGAEHNAATGDGEADKRVN
ncbi:MAG: VanZ family protein, partial [Clostridia bacterium]|nr:VanZ family protein [Clostridia bacterium]